MILTVSERSYFCVNRTYWNYVKKWIFFSKRLPWPGAEPWIFCCFFPIFFVRYTFIWDSYSSILSRSIIIECLFMTLDTLFEYLIHRLELVLFIDFPDHAVPKQVPHRYMRGANWSWRWAWTNIWWPYNTLSRYYLKTSGYNSMQMSICPNTKSLLVSEGLITPMES